MLPILALNEYKIANPTLLARIPAEELETLMRGYGFEPHHVVGDDPTAVHQTLAATMATCLDQISAIQQAARAEGPEDHTTARWPMIILSTPKGWTGPPVVDGQQVEGTFRAHQVPLPGVRQNPEHREALEPPGCGRTGQELFDEAGALVPEAPRPEPDGGAADERQPGRQRRPADARPAAAGLEEFGVRVDRPGATSHEATRVLGGWLREVTRMNPDAYLTFAPDELASNRLQDILDVTGRRWQVEIDERDERLDRRGRAIEVLSEHMCQGLLEGYLLTGRHGLFTCYEAFIHIVDSMFNQHAKWLSASAAVPWRRPIPSLNYLLSSHVWRQDHNGFTHQDPGFLDVVLNKKPEIVRVYLPPDANTLLSTVDHCLRSALRQRRGGGQAAPVDWLDVQERPCTAPGAPAWAWAGTGRDRVGT